VRGGKVKEADLAKPETGGFLRYFKEGAILILSVKGRKTPLLHGGKKKKKKRGVEPPVGKKLLATSWLGKKTNGRLYLGGRKSGSSEKRKGTVSASRGAVLLMVQRGQGISEKEKNVTVGTGGRREFWEESFRQSLKSGRKGSQGPNFAKE